MRFYVGQNILETTTGRMILVLETSASHATITRWAAIGTDYLVGGVGVFLIQKFTPSQIGDWVF